MRDDSRFEVAQLAGGRYAGPRDCDHEGDDMTDARHAFVAAVTRTDRHRDALEVARLEVARLEAIFAESERLESESFSALCAQTLQPPELPRASEMTRVAS